MSSEINSYSRKDGAMERMKRALEDGNDGKANDIAIEYEFSSEELKCYTRHHDQEKRPRNPYEADRLQQLRGMQAEEILALAKQEAHELLPTESISCEYFLGAPHAHYKIHERQRPKPQQTRKDSRFETIDSKAYEKRRRVKMNRKEKVMGNQAHLQRKWREVPKDELDTWPGKPVPVDKATESMRKKNKRVEARRRATKRQTARGVYQTAQTTC